MVKSKLIKFRCWSLTGLFLALLGMGPIVAQTNSEFPPPNIPELLGWVPLPASANICCGYYKDPLAPFITLPLPPLSTTSVQVSAEQTHFEQNGPSILLGHVTVTQPGRFVTGNQASLIRDAKTGQINSVDLTGHVEVREPGKLIVADRGHIELGSKMGKLFHAIYHFVLGGPAPFSKIYIDHPTPALFPCVQPQTVNAWGVADSVERKSCGIIELKHATYSTCAPTSHTWKLSATTIDLDPNIGRGKAYNTLMTVQHVPVFYTPYFSFPLDHRRQTGFLFPTYGHSSLSGYTFGAPFYWNIAPNYDATLTPLYYTKRNFFGDGLFRYLTNWSSGAIRGGFIPNDLAFADFKNDAQTSYAGNPALSRLLNSSNNRGYVSWQNNTNIDSHWSSDVNFNYVSDDYFLEDFNKPNTLVQNQLQQMADVKYHDKIWTFIGKVQAYQALHPVNMAAVTNPYESLPELDLNAYLPNQAYGLNYRLNNQFVYFDRNRNPGEDINPINASRVNIQPSVSWPHTGLSGYFTPQLLVNMTGYQVGNQAPGYQNNITRALPTFDIDSGLYFDRDFTLFHTQYQQTLEPRLFYLFTPYKNQDNIPLFDTAIVPFSYDSLYLTNRFSGYDRIGDANQITAGLTTRFLDQTTGAEKFRASIGEIYYFRNRFITACGPPGSPAALASGTVCGDTTTLIGATSPTEVASPLAGQMVYHFTPALSANANGVWDPNIRQPVNGNLNLQYSPELNHILNLGYNFIRYGDPQPNTKPGSHLNDLNQASASLAWPIHDRWQILGSISYDIVHHYPQSYLYGLEYDSCCWAARFVAGRSFVGLNQNNNPTFNNAVYFQWQFKGLGSVGNANPAAVLMSTIPGYRDVFDNLSFFQE